MTTGTSHPRQPLNAAGVLAQALAERPSAEAVVARSGRLTYRELEDFASRNVRALIAAGVSPGDRIGVSLPNDLPLVGLFHGAMRLGAIWVGINRNLAPPEKAYLLRNSEASFFIGDADMVEHVRGVKDQHDVGRYLVADSATDSEWSDLLGADGAATSEPPPCPDPLAPAAIAYTSGTTGFPKGAVHSQHNLMVPGMILIEARGYGPSLRKGDCFPLTILNLQVLSTLLVPQCGGTAIVMDRVDPIGIAEWIATERATTWNGAPAMLYGLATNEEVRPESLASLDDVWSGGSPCPKGTAERFRAKFGHRVHSSYGSTEVPTVVSIAPRAVDVDIASTGPPLPHLKVHIRDDQGQPRPTGSVGEICVGPTDDASLASLYRPMLGYWNNPKATSATIKDGLLHTGDVGFLDDNGFLFVQDRRQSLILRGGANVYPAEVERIINDFPGIAGSCVLGVPDERLGARVIAVVELDEGQEGPQADHLDVDGLRTHCGANLARYKVPERFFVRPLPRNAMGKVKAVEVQKSLGPVDLSS
ncbi:MAG TPA: AMP-binding protein [Acidimicrobiales bacterium]|nr:AMP-binding protein [Acidimicrobiales bacterium]